MFSSNTSGPGVATDPQFNYVTMLLHGNGTNGAQNNTFLDSSTNNFTITRNGNTTQGTFSPYGSNWSNYFDGSGDYLSVAHNTALVLSGDFTIEFWLNADSGNVYRAGVIGKREQSTFTNGVDWVIRVETTDGKIGFGYNSAGNYYDMGTYVVGEWAHYAITRSGSSIKTFKNGTQVATATDSSTYTNSEPVRIGINIAGYEYKGYISNLRIVKGTAVYTSNFTPSTSPLTAITNTSLLTCQSNRFIDNSTNAFTITRNGDVSVQRFSPFNPTASYAAETIGGSGVFDAVGDTLTTPVNAAFNLGTGAFQIDFWMYPTGSPGQFMGPFGTNNNGGTGGIFFANRSGNLDFVSNNDNITLIRATYPSLNNWHHVVLVRNSSGLRAFFLDGVRVGTASDAADFNQTQFTLGAYNASFGGWPGYLSNFRIIKGSNIADPNSATVAVPTAPTTAVAGTQFLCNFTNAGIIDNAMMNNLETVGNAQISTAQSKFGGASMAFDGSGDYLVSNPATSNLYAFGTGDFTIEFWINPTTTSGTQIIYEGRPLSTNGAYPTIYLSGTTLVYYANDGDRISGGTISTGVFSHIAVSRSGTSTRMFLNGTQVGSTYTDSTNYLGAAGAPRIWIGAFGSTTIAGYIDDLRITKGYARYTANFTPPSAPFPDN